MICATALGFAPLAGRERTHLVALERAGAVFEKGALVGRPGDQDRDRDRDRDG